MKKLTFKELISLVKSNVKPVIIITKKFAENTDLIYSEGMRARVLGAAKDNNGRIELIFGSAEFDAFNRTIAKREWYNTTTEKYDATYFEYYERIPGSTVPLIDTWFFGEDDIESGETEKEFGHFEVEEELNTALFFLHQKDVASGCKMSYVQWLEDKVMATLL